MLGIIDRFENNFAVVELENEKMINIDVSKLPQDVKEGDVLNIDEEITINFEQTQKLKKQIDKLIEDIWE